MGRGTFGVSDQLKSIVKHSSGPILMVHASYDMFLFDKLPFWGPDDCTCVKIFIGINF